jgi:cytochrome oxidase Cu insertion factor (SCO1/SenC/PrrC family)
MISRLPWWKTLSGAALLVVTSAIIILLPAFMSQTHRSVSIPEELASYERLAIFFGYVDCPAICPTTMKVLAEAYRALPAERQASLGIVFINLTKDTPQERVQAYAHGFHPKFVGLQSAADTRRQLLKDFGVQLNMSIPVPETDHSLNVYFAERHDDQWALTRIYTKSPPNLDVLD